MNDNDLRIHKVVAGNPAGLADFLVDLTRDICLKTGKDPADGVGLLLLAAMKIFVDHAAKTDRMPDALAAIVKDMAEVYLKELEGTTQ